MNSIWLIGITITLWLCEWLYIRMADKYNIIDKPNERSSHTNTTIRGGGMLFPIAWLLYFFMSGMQLPWLSAGLVLIAVVSFIDDVKGLRASVRFLAHVVALSFLFYQVNLFHQYTWWQLLMAYIFSIGCMNAVNFMDGINGMTGMYGLSVLLPMFLFYKGEIQYNHIVYVILALLVFGFYNFRKKAKCFAGDVGSVSLGYLFIYYLLFAIHSFQPGSWFFRNQEITNNQSYVFILFLALYGIDSIFTIAQRLWNKENIFQPHRKHLYQYLANEMGWNHLMVAALYALLQLCINILILLGNIRASNAIYFLLVASGVYVLLKLYLHNKIMASSR